MRSQDEPLSDAIGALPGVDQPATSKCSPMVRWSTPSSRQLFRGRRANQRLKFGPPAGALHRGDSCASQVGPHRSADGRGVTDSSRPICVAFHSPDERLARLCGCEKFELPNFGAGLDREPLFISAHMSLTTEAHSVVAIYNQPQMAATIITAVPHDSLGRL